MALQLQSVLISDSVDDSCRRILEEAGIKVVTKTSLTKEQLQEEIKEHDGLIVRSATKVTADIIKAGKKLKIIGRAGTGVDNIDQDAATAQGIIVMNTPGGNTLSAAELTCTMVLVLSRHLPQAHMSMKEGRWDRKKFMGMEVLGKTLAIVGLGRIGREVATRMQSFGMRTIGYDPLVPAEQAAEFGVEFMELKDIWPLADFITVHTPLIPQTKGLINWDTFSKCKKGVCVINCARGGIIDEDDLVAALISGQCGGAGLDVFVEEPPKNTSLIQHPNVVCTPHLGASTKEAQLRVAKEIAEQFVDTTKGKSYFGVVNSPALATANEAAARPWVELTQRLAQLSSSVLQKVTSVQVTSGKKKLLRVLQVAALTGAIKASLPHINMVSAPLVAKSAGVTATNTAGSEDTVTVVTSGEGGAMSMTGTVCGNKAFLTVVESSSVGFVLLEGTMAVLKGAGVKPAAVADVLLKGMAIAGDVIVCSLCDPLTDNMIANLKKTGLTSSQVTF